MRLYTLPVQATARDIDSNGHVNNIVYVQWMQDIAIAHSDAVGCTAATTAAGCTWVARSHHIEYLRPAYAGDTVNVQSWVVEATRKSSPRAATGWCAKTTAPCLPGGRPCGFSSTYAMADRAPFQRR